MYLVGLTGGIGSGKSTVSDILSKKGYKVIDADKISREITKDGSPVVNQLAGLFGDEILIKDKVLNRSKLADIVFSDREKKKKLDDFMMIRIISDINVEISALSDERMVFLDAPLLFETGLNNICDEVWLVLTNIEDRIFRIIKRDGITKEKVLARIENQMSDEEKIKKSQVIIDNNGTVESLAVLLKKELEEVEGRINVYEKESEEDINIGISGDPFLGML